MKYTIDKHDRYIVIEPHVKVIDTESASKLKGEFLLRNTIGQRNIILDLAHVERIDEIGIRLGILAGRLCRSVGGLFILANVKPAIKEMIALSRLDNSFQLTSSVRDAEDILFAHELESDYRSGDAEQ